MFHQRKYRISGPPQRSRDNIELIFLPIFRIFEQLKVDTTERNLSLVYCFLFLVKGGRERIWVSCWITDAQAEQLGGGSFSRTCQEV